MIARYVFLRLTPEYRGDAVADIAAHSRRVLASLPHVKTLHVGQPADGHAGKGWDLSIALTFEDLEAVEAYRVHPEHRRYVDDYLKPRLQVIKAWNFDIG